jgi:transposase
MQKEMKVEGVAPDLPEGARSATGGKAGAAAEVKRWSAGRKKEVVLRLMRGEPVLRLMRGEPVDAVSRDVAVPIYKLEQWRDRALAGIDAGLKERENDPVERQLDEANRRIGELVMEVEILQKERRARRPLVGRRSSR